MATTSPDNIWTPDAGDDYALTTDLAATADTVQDAITAQGTRFTSAVANQAARDALFASPAQGNRVFRNDLGYEEVYLGLYNSTTNPQGASTAGWYPTRRMFVASRTGTQTFGANWNVVGSAITQIRNDGLGTFSAGAFTVVASGMYKVRASAYLQNGVNPNAIQILRNSTTPDTSAAIAAGIVEGVTTRGGYAIQNTVTLAAGDIVRVLVYAGPSSGNSINTTLGTSTATFTIEKV